MGLSCLRTPPRAVFREPRPLVKPIGQSVLLRQSQLLPASLMRRRRTPLPQIRSSFNHHQVFEDGAEGIICYRDESGEIICEGYDEGPRFRPKISGTPFAKRDAEIIDRLQQNWIQTVKGSEVYQGLFVQEEGFNCNGFNNLR